MGFEEALKDYDDSHKRLLDILKELRKRKIEELKKLDSDISKGVDLHDELEAKEMQKEMNKGKELK